MNRSKAFTLQTISAKNWKKFIASCLTPCGCNEEDKISQNLWRDDMKMKFHGPLGEVTGSCYELTDSALGLHVLVDYGMKQGVADAQDWNNAFRPCDPRTLDFVLLTHAHLDHCGLIPLLYKHGFTGKVICTRETAELAEINLMGACKHSALYNRNHVAAIEWEEPPSPVLDFPHKLHRGVTVIFRRTAHILGATSLQIEWGSADDRKQLTFSGDIGNNTRGTEFQSLLRHRIDPPEPITERSYVVMESTYGGQKVSAMQKNFDVRMSSLKKSVEHTVLDKKGCMIIPCFAIERTQSVLFDLHYLFATNPELRDVPVLFDARMAGEVNSVYARSLRRTEEIDGECRPMWLSEQLHRRMGLDPNSPDDTKLLGELLAATFDPAFEMPIAAADHPSDTIKNWKRIWRPTSSINGLSSDVRGPSIVITGSGMCDGGPIVNYFSELLIDKRNTVLLTGYCGPKTNGGKLLWISNQTINQRKKHHITLTWTNSTINVPLASIRADIAKINGYSGHADHDGLLNWFFGWKNSRHYTAGKTVFLTHGNDDRRAALAEAIRQKASAVDAGQSWSAQDLDVQCPERTDGCYDLENGAWVTESKRLKKSSLTESAGEVRLRA